MDKAVDIEKKLVSTIIFPKSAQKSLSSQINFYERNMEIHKTTINWIMSCSPVIFLLHKHQIARKSWGQNDFNV